MYKCQLPAGVHVPTSRGGQQLAGDTSLGLEYAYKHLPAARAVVLLYSHLGHSGTSPNMSLDPISSLLLAVC